MVDCEGSDLPNDELDAILSHGLPRLQTCGRAESEPAGWFGLETCKMCTRPWLSRKVRWPNTVEESFQARRVQWSGSISGGTAMRARCRSTGRFAAGFRRGNTFRVTVRIRIRSGEVGVTEEVGPANTTHDRASSHDVQAPYI